MNSRESKRGRPLGIVMLAVALATSASIAVAAQTPSRRASPNTWSARSSTGLTLAGTWTVVSEQAGTATGTWALVGANGAAVATGGWSAAKSPDGWSGTWRAAVSGGKTEYSGTWSATTDLKANASFADLFEKAMQTVVSGNWRAGRQSGAWSIRVSK